MEEKKESSNSGFNGIIKNLDTPLPEHITVLDLSNRKISEFDEKLVFPPNLIELNISHNNLTNISSALLNVQFLKKLDVSFNSIQYFDDTPNFCHSIESLDLSNNSLEGPPYWVWTETPNKLEVLNLSNNVKITKSFENGYFEELLSYKTLVKELVVYNCAIIDHINLLSTFSKVKKLEFGYADYRKILSNQIHHIPCKGLDQCIDIEHLNLSNTQLYTVEPDIDIYKHLVYLNLSYNDISGIPSRFCNLENLETCILSGNKILYLPDELSKLKSLKYFHIDSNQLCMLTYDICNLNLKVLDVYDNSLYEVPEGVWDIEEIDLAQNYLDEPETEEYLERKRKLRLKLEERSDGRKLEYERPLSEGTASETDDEELIKYLNNLQENEQENQEVLSDSSIEDWDSDSYWIPSKFSRSSKRPTSQSPWVYYVIRKMKEGNFCPMDLHTVSVTEQVKYDKLCNPKPIHYVDGQFDDLTDDES